MSRASGLGGLAVAVALSGCLPGYPGDAAGDGGGTGRPDATTGDGAVPVGSADATTDGGAEAGDDGAGGEASFDGSMDADACSSSPACSPGATLCLGNGVQTCDACGQWATAVPCGGTTPLCENGMCTAPPSCAGMPASCGANAESCCASPEITPNGSFFRTYTNSGDGGTGEADPATLSAFRLDKYLVTVGRFRRFVNAVLPSGGGVGWLPAEGSGKHAHLHMGRGLVDVRADAGPVYEPGWVAADSVNIAPTDGNLACDSSDATWTPAVGGNENLPINCVNYYEAAAFCIWDGGFLPSQAEWEYAAAGGAQQREYPWGSTDPGTGSQYAVYDCLYPSGSAGNCTGLANIAPVGSAALGAGLWGQLDISGELAQWNLDLYGTGNYVNPCADCANLTDGTDRTAQGGSFTFSGGGWIRANAASSTRFLALGFRCARIPHSASGTDAGADASVPSPCAPGSTRCSTGADGGTTNGVQTCDATGTWGAPATCNQQTCVQTAGAASCQGQCAPGQTHPVACGPCGTGTNTQTCSASGTWQDGACAGQGCSPGTTQACNTYGSQTCGSSCGWGTCSCGSPAVCTPHTTQCSGNGIHTCDACGQWGPTTACTASQQCSNGVCAAIPSCSGSLKGTIDCGANGNENCCTSPEVTGGSYYRTYTNSGSGPTGQADPATVSGYRLDKYLVTVGRFRQFVNAVLPPDGGAGWLPPAGAGKHVHLNGGMGLSNNFVGGAFEGGWATTDNGNVVPTNGNLSSASCAPYSTWSSPTGNDNLPINCVNWYEAYAFCIWDGGFLPSEAEWEYAAAGGSQQLEYPWGSADPGTSNQRAIYGCYYPSGSGSCTGLTNIAPVGTAFTQGAGLWGQLDLAGEVYEWTLDSYRTYAPCTDCVSLAQAVTYNVLRGGSFVGAKTDLLPQTRSFYPPTSRYNTLGFRCARTP